MGQELTTQRCCGMNNAYSTNSSIASPPSGLNASNDNDNTSIHTHSSHDRRSNVHQPSSSPNARKQRNTSHERRQQGGNSIDKGRHETKRKGNGRVGRARDRNTRHIPRRTQNEKLVVCGIGLYDELGPHVLRALHARFVRRKQTQRRRRIRARERSKGQNGTANGDASAGDLDSHSQHSHNEKDRSSTGGIGQEEGDVNAVDNDIEYRLIAIPSDCLSPASLLAAAERKKKRKKKEKEKEHARKKEREKKKNKERKKKNKKHRRKHKKKGKQKTQKDSIDDVEDDHAESSDSSDSSGSSDNDIENSDGESEDLSDSELTLSRERARERQNHTRRQQLLQAYQQDIPSLKITPHALQDVAESGREADRPDKLSKSYRHIIGALRGSAVCVLLTPSPAAVRMCFEAKVKHLIYLSTPNASTSKTILATQHAPVEKLIRVVGAKSQTNWTILRVPMYMELLERHIRSFITSSIVHVNFSTHMKFSAICKGDVAYVIRTIISDTLGDDDDTNDHEDSDDDRDEHPSTFVDLSVYSDHGTGRINTGSSTQRIGHNSSTSKQPPPHTPANSETGHEEHMHRERLQHHKHVYTLSCKPFSMDQFRKYCSDQLTKQLTFQVKSYTTCRSELLENPVITEEKAQAMMEAFAYVDINQYNFVNHYSIFTKIVQMKRKPTKMKHFVDNYLQRYNSAAAFQHSLHTYRQ